MVKFMILSRMGFGLVIGFIELLQIVITRNYSAVNNLDTQTLTMAQTKSSMSSPAVAW
jgi:hypothetical protein